MTITKEEYDTYAKNSFFVDNNFSGRYAPSNISSNMIPYDKLQEFHYQTSFFLNFYSSLYIELKYYEETINNNASIFANTIENMGIKINTTSINTNYNLSTFSINASISSNYDFTFFLNRFQEKTSNQHHLYAHGTLGTDVSYLLSYSNIIEKSKPNFGSYPDILTISDYSNNLILISATISTTADGAETQSNKVYLIITDILTRLNSISSLPETSKTIKKNVNKSKFKEIIEEIFSQKPENIIGYLLYKKIYYNIILYNIGIQANIRVNYLNDTNRYILTENIISNLIITASPIGNTQNNLNDVNNCITTKTKEIFILNNIHFESTNEYLVEKNEYRNKINALNTLKEEYNKIQDKLNISTKLYNQQFKNYKTIKFYATYVIIALIIIIILTISLSIFPIFSVDVKNSIYIISLIVLILITYLYYTNFKYVNLYEKFFIYSTATAIPSSATAVINFDVTSATHRTNHAKFYTQLLPAINQYNNAYNDLMNNIRMNMYTIGSKTFSQDANIYLYNLYLEKKRQNENNKIKYTNLFNMIEIIKKQINFLFNIVFILGCFCIILLLGLVLYSTTPELYIFIIILCVILISILMIYFGFAIIQPTRMIVNKNYWAIVNPSKTAISKL